MGMYINQKQLPLLMKLFFQNVDKKQAISWAFFDFANSAYSTLINSLAFPIFFKDIVAGPELGDFYWGLIVGISILLSGMAAPILGAMADYNKSVKNKFMLFTILSIIGTAGLFFSDNIYFTLACLLFIITNFFYNLN